ncbi:exosporium glycoprotein BclB-related protein, partial [Bacillus pseudomycoides]
GGGGAIVAFSSGLTPANMTVIGPGLIGIPSFIGFGTATPGAVVLGANINLLGLENEAFTVPRVGILDSIFANYTATGFSVASTATVRAQLYINLAVNNNTNVFTPFGPLVTLAPPIVGIVGFLNADGNATGINLQVNPGDRLLMVFSLLGGTGSVASVLSGNASAGISIL